MQEPAKRFRHIMNIFTEEQLCSFGNFLLKTYGVQVHSGDGKNLPIYQREVTDADFSNWQWELNQSSNTATPSQFQIGSRAKFCCMPDEAEVESFPGILCEVLAVHFYAGKVKYDLDLLFAGDQRSRIYNVDSVLVLPRSAS